VSLCTIAYASVVGNRLKEVALLSVSHGEKGKAPPGVYLKRVGGREKI
jgi:hypothetical protein